MTVAADPTTSAPDRPVEPTAATTWVLWSPLAIACSTALGIGLFLLVPFFANGLHRVPLAEVAGGRHDPKELWPQALDGPIGGVFALGGLATVVLGLAFTAAVFCFTVFVAARDRRRVARPHAWALAISAVVLGWFLSPVGGAVLAWWLD